MKTELTDRKIVRQSHSLNFSKFSLSALSIDVLHLFFAQIAKEDVEFKEFRITFRELEKKLDKRVNKKYIDNVCHELLSNPIRIKEEKSILVCNFVSSCRYSVEEGWLQLKISDDLKNHLLGLDKNFVLSNYIQVSKMKGNYSKRIYTMLRQYKRIGVYKVEVSNLMDILDVEDKYSLYGDFKRRVIDAAVKEINEKSTDLKVSYREIKNGRKVESIEFYIKGILTPIEESIEYVNSLEVKKPTIETTEEIVNLVQDEDEDYDLYDLDNPIF